jgi:tetratricopeptide (TPR) repeat protein
MRTVALLLGVLTFVIPGACQEASHFQEGLRALATNGLEEALTEFTLAEKGRPGDPRIHNFRGIVLARLGRLGEAEKEYREAIRLDPHLADAYRNLGFLLWSARHLNQSNQAFLSALEVEPGDAHTLFDLGEIELQQGRYKEALAHLNESGLPWPRDAGFLLRVAAGEMSLAQPAEALKTAGMLEGMRLTSAQTVSLGTLLIALDRYGDGLALFERIERENRGTGWAEFNLARAEELTGDAREAATRALALASHGGGWPAWSLAGIAEARLGDHERSLEAFRRAAELDRHDEKRWLDLTRELMDAQQYQEAAEAAQEGLQFNPRSYALRLRMGSAYLNAGRYTPAERVFRDLVARNDPFPTSAIGLAQVLLRTGRAQQAVDVMTQTQERLGDNFLVAYFRGIALERAGKPQQAITAFQDALRFNPSNADAHRWLGDVELQSQHAGAAIDELKQCVKLDPSDAEARVLLGRAYRMARDSGAAATIGRDVTPSPLPAAGQDESQAFAYPDWQLPPQSP